MFNALLLSLPKSSQEILAGSIVKVDFFNLGSQLSPLKTGTHVEINRTENAPENGLVVVCARKKKVGMRSSAGRGCRPPPRPSRTLPLATSPVHPPSPRSGTMHLSRFGLLALGAAAVEAFRDTSPFFLASTSEYVPIGPCKLQSANQPVGSWPTPHTSNPPIRCSMTSLPSFALALLTTISSSINPVSTARTLRLTNWHPA